MAAGTTDGKGHAKVFATGRKSGTMVNGVGGNEYAVVRVAGTGSTDVGRGTRRIWLVAGGELILLGGVRRSLGRSRGCVVGSLGSLPGLFLLVIRVDPHSWRSGVVGQVVLDGSHGPFCNELHVHGLGVDEESVRDLNVVEDFVDVAGVSGNSSQFCIGHVVNVDSDGVREMFAMG